MTDWDAKNRADIRMIQRLRERTLARMDRSLALLAVDSPEAAQVRALLFDLLDQYDVLEADIASMTAGLGLPMEEPNGGGDTP